MEAQSQDRLFTIFLVFLNYNLVLLNVLTRDIKPICLQVSKLSDWLGHSLTGLQNVPPFAISILLSMLVALFTECSSNTATTTIFLPILASMVMIQQKSCIFFSRRFRGETFVVINPQST